MRIGMPTTSFPRTEDDPAGRFVLDLAVELAARGHEVDVLAPEPREGDMRLSLPARVSLTWIPYLRPRALERTFYGAGAPENLARDPLAWPGALTHPIALTWAVASRLPQWEAVVSHWALPAGLAVSLAELKAGIRRPHVCVVHSGDAHLLSRLALRQQVARLLRARFVASSRATRDVLAQSFPEGSMPPIEVLPMGTNEPLASGAERAQARAESGIQVESLLLLSLARLVPIKRVDLAIDAVRRVPTASLAVAGDGPLRVALEHQAGARVRFLGTVGPRERRAWLAASDAMVLGSTPRASGRTEGTPVSVLEALASGLPVIASATGGVLDVVRHEENGLLVTPGDGASLTSAVERLARDPELLAHLRAGARESRIPKMSETAARLEALVGRAV